jgi:hypothetical protein
MTQLFQAYNAAQFHLLLRRQVTGTGCTGLSANKALLLRLYQIIF